jgi:hypothetical protein
LHLFNFFDAHASQLLSFDGFAEFWCIPFTALSILSIFFCFFFSLISVLSSGPVILSSTCFSLLEWLPPVFLFDLRKFVLPGLLFDSIL